MSDDQYHIMRMNGMSPSGLPLPESAGESELPSSTGSDDAGELRACRTALKAVLMFHSASPWTFDKNQDWQLICHELLGRPKYVYRL